LEGVEGVIAEKTKTAAAEWKRLADLNGVVEVEKALMFATALLVAAKEVIADKGALRKLQSRTLALLPPPEN
jgi:hypothetical protein